MRESVDPRIWNIVVGALMAAGCTTRVASSQSEETTGTTDAEPECPPCPDKTYCANGNCYYYPWDESDPYTECYEDADCPAYTICDYFHQCNGPGEPPPPDCEPGSVATPIPVEGEALALTFADVDADSQDELVVATATSLLVYEADLATPTASPRSPGLVTQMVAGRFDLAQGEDVVELVGDVTRMYSSTANNSFAAAIEQPSPIANISDLLAGDYDGAAPLDLLAWGPDGAFVRRGGVTSNFDYIKIDTATAFEFGTPNAGFYFCVRGWLLLNDLAGEQTAMLQHHPPYERSWAHFESPDEEWIVGLLDYWEWTWVYFHSPGSEGLDETDWYLLPGALEQVLAGDLDGDGLDELVFNSADGVVIQYQPQRPGDCLDTPSVGTGGVARAVALGDLDGDGDDEIGILTSLGEVAVVDGG